MRYEDLPVFELTVVFAMEPDRAGAVLESVTELVCAETGGRGEGTKHVCGGYHCAAIRRLPEGLLEDVDSLRV